MHGNLSWGNSGGKRVSSLARKKTITRDNILNAAFDLVVEQGFSNFTARNLAKFMNCSTQPIYLEFSCMGDLKNTVLAKVQNYLQTKVYSQHYYDNALVNIFLAHIDLARTNRALYQAIFVDDHFGVSAMRDFVYETAYEKMAADEKMKALPDKLKNEIILHCWIAATGIATLYSAEYIDLTQAQMIQFIESQIETTIRTADTASDDAIQEHMVS